MHDNTVAVIVLFGGLAIFMVMLIYQFGKSANRYMARVDEKRKAGNVN